MKKFYLALAVFVILILAGVFFLQSEEPASHFKGLTFNKIFSKDSLIAEKVKFIAKGPIRLFSLGDSLYISTVNSVIGIDTNLNATKPVFINHRDGSSVYSAFKVSDSMLLQMYPSKELIILKSAASSIVKLPEAYINSTLLDGKIVGFYISAQSKPCIQVFDFRNDSVVSDTEVSSLFKSKKNFLSNECFAESLLGDFAYVNKDRIAWYCTYNSYFIDMDRLNNVKLQTGIDSIPLVQTAMVTTKVSKDMSISKCTYDDRIVTLHSTSDGSNLYVLSNITSSKVTACKSIDIYDLKTFTYKHSIKVPQRGNTEAGYIAINVKTKGFYVLYDDGQLVSYSLKKL